MSFIFARVLAVVLTITAGIVWAHPNPQEDASSTELLALLPYLNDEKLALPETLRQSRSCSTHLIISALLYRRDPNEYRNEFFASLVIDDYAERDAGRYNYIEPDAIAATVDSSMVVPGGITDNRIRTVVGFCALKDKNLWVATEKLGRISLARVVRGMAMSALLAGTNEDSLAIANAVDAHTASGRKFPEP